jgi:hypothetical protein
VTFKLASPATPAMITVPETENFSPNSSSTRSGRAADPAFSIICAVDLATLMGPDRRQGQPD